MIGQRGTSTALSAALSGALALGLLAGGAAHAQEGVTMREALSGIGLIEPDRPAINYQERAPLVMPPNLSGKGAAAKSKGKGRTAAKDAAMSANADAEAPFYLPPPQTRAEDPRWPKEPEVARRERAAAERDKPIVRGAQGRMNDNNMTLSVDELQAGRRAGAGLSSDPAPRPGENRESTWLDPFQLFSDKKIEPSATVEPERDGLTDPPTGYRKAPVKVVAPQGGPMGGSISGNEEADPRAYMRSQSGR